MYGASLCLCFLKMETMPIARLRRRRRTPKAGVRVGSRHIENSIATKSKRGVNFVSKPSFINRATVFQRTSAGRGVTIIEEYCCFAKHLVDWLHRLPFVIAVQIGISEKKNSLV